MDSDQFFTLDDLLNLLTVEGNKSKDYAYNMYKVGEYSIIVGFMNGEKYAEREKRILFNSYFDFFVCVNYNLARSILEHRYNRQVELGSEIKAEMNICKICAMAFPDQYRH